MRNGLVILPNLRCRPLSGGGYLLPRKFTDGVRMYAREWPGPITVLLENLATADGQLDLEPTDPKDLPFDLRTLRLEDFPQDPAMASAAVVLASTDFRQNDVASECARIGVPCVYVAEYSLRTRIQAANAEVPGLFGRLRRMLWELRQEVRQSRAIARSHGIQCNGTPTFRAYARKCRRPLLYFDSRITRGMVAAQEEIDARLQILAADMPIRLLFSGRLVDIKGADHLLRVASHLRDLSVRFHLTICGDGALAPRMRREIETLGLSGHVAMRGTLDFAGELVPLVKHSTDLFVCCHRQGDPSCTYIETMACGVPIIGYDNEALRGMIERSNAGWTSPMDRPDHLARRIAGLGRDEIHAASLRALEFAGRHTFEAEFSRRIAHLREVADGGARARRDDRTVR